MKENRQDFIWAIKKSDASAFKGNSMDTHLEHACVCVLSGFLLELLPADCYSVSVLCFLVLLSASLSEELQKMCGWSHWFQLRASTHLQVFPLHPSHPLAIQSCHLRTLVFVSTHHQIHLENCFQVE